MTLARPRVLLLYTGGTIGMTEHPESGALVPLDFDNLEALLPELRRLEVDLEVMELPAQDSSQHRSDQLAANGQHRETSLCPL